MLGISRKKREEREIGKKEREKRERGGRRKKIQGVFKVLAWISTLFLCFSWCVKVSMAKLSLDTLLNHSFSMLI